ncbi:hypothetical protein P3S67_004664 [Capsicum chacoense]
MAVYFKYRSAKDYDSIPVIDQFITVGNLKLRIFESERYEILSVLIRLVPGLPRLPIVVIGPKQVTKEKEVANSSISAKYLQDFECDDFGDDVYAIPKLMPI